MVSLVATAAAWLLALSPPALASAVSTAPVRAVSGFPWGTLILAVITALLIGGYVGNRVATKRLARPRISVYGIIEGRLKEGRTA